MTQEDYEQKKRECWKEFCKEHPLDATANGGVAFCYAFDRAYALGKQEKEEDTVIQGWVARDSDGDLNLFYGNKPYREANDEYWSIVFGECIRCLPENMFPDVKWEDAEPTKVEIIIKRKKK